MRNEAYSDAISSFFCDFMKINKNNNDDFKINILDIGTGTG